MRWAFRQTFLSHYIDIRASYARSEEKRYTSLNQYQIDARLLVGYSEGLVISSHPNDGQRQATLR